MKNEKKRDAQLRLKELELKEKELALQVKLKELEVKATGSPSGSSDASATLPFDVSKHIKFVPAFHETEVDKYFLHFEKVARSSKWPEEEWTLLLQSSLVGKAREVYSALSVDDSGRYEIVKNAILKAYELVPEAYRQKFRGTAKGDNQTHVEFTRQKETLFDRWCKSKEISKNFENLRQLILVEEFKNCVSCEVKTYLDEKKADTLKEAAVLADDYVLTHKGVFNQRTPTVTHLDQRAPPFVPSNHGQRQNNVRGSGKNQQLNARGRRRNSLLPAGPECYYCKKKGHVMADCWHLKNANSGTLRPTMMTIRDQSSLSRVRPGISSYPAELNRAMDEYTPFISKGFIHALGSKDQIPITILRDTGADQSLLLESSLPQSAVTSTGASTLIQGVEFEIVNVPLH